MNVYIQQACISFISSTRSFLPYLLRIFHTLIISIPFYALVIPCSPATLFQKIACTIAEFSSVWRFKPFSHKNDASLSFIPTNCLVQPMFIASERDPPSCHFITRTAAFGAYSLGFDDLMRPQPLVSGGVRKSVLQDMEKLARRLQVVHTMMVSIRPVTARAMHAFAAEGEGEVNLEEGEIVYIRHESVRGWCELLKPSGVRGRVPSSDLERFGDLSGVW